MSRFTTTPLSQLPDDLKPYGQRLEDMATRSFGPSGSLITYRNAEGGLIGPFPFYLESRDAGVALADAGDAIAKIPGLPSDAKEAALLVVGTRFQAGYEVYAHARIAVQRAGLLQHQVDAIVAGKTPEGLGEAATAAHAAAYALVHKPGPLSQGLFDDCQRVLGKDGTLGLIHFVGYYCYVSVILNASDAAVPKD